VGDGGWGMGDGGWGVNIFRDVWGKNRRNGMNEVIKKKIIIIIINGATNTTR
jgi:hypothetical protein